MIAAASRAASWTAPDEAGFALALDAALRHIEATGHQALIRVFVEKTEGF